MADSTINPDAFSTLLAEALRAGPGTPVWRETLEQLGAKKSLPQEELQLLLRVREHLESGKPYRAIRAAPEFTRRLMLEVDKPSAPATSIISRSFWLIAGSSIAALTAMIIVAVILFRSLASPSDSPPSAAPLLVTVASEDFDGPISGEWRRIGDQPLSSIRGSLRPTTQPQQAGRGGGIVWLHAIPPSEPFSVSVTINLPKPSGHTLAEVFVTDTGDFNSISSVSSHEWVWLLEGRAISVLDPNGPVQFQSQLPPDFHGSLPLRLTFNGERVALDQQDRSVWKGVSGLDSSKPRQVGLRFLNGASESAGDLFFAKLRINMRHSLVEP